MEWLDFQQRSLAFNFGVLAVATAVVWQAGTRLAKYAAAIARITGMGQAVVGMLLLGSVTSLPEIAIAITSAINEDASLTVNNLLGTVALQITLLAIADAIIGRNQALTHVVANPSVLLQGTMAILMLTVVAAGVFVGDRTVFGVGLWCWALVLIYVAAILTISKAPSAWKPLDARQKYSDKSRTEELDTGEGLGGEAEDEETLAQQSLARVLAKTAAAGGVILVAGFLLSRTADAIAEQSGLGANFVGAVLLSFCTSMPEISTVFTSVRRRRYVMAVSEILGTALFNILLIVLVDAVYRGEPVLNQVGRFSGFAALLSIVLIALYVAGFIERRNRMVLRMGVDSLAVLMIYFGGLIVLYQLR